MNLKPYIKKFPFPDNFQPPTELKYEDLVAKPLTRSDLKADMEAVNSSMDLIRETRGGSWPSEPVTEDFDFLDLAWHEREFRDNGSFAYVVYDGSENYIGCFYLYPMGLRTELTENTNNFDVDASWWVTTKANENGYYEKLYSAIQQWLSKYPTSKVYYSNKRIPS